MNDMINTKVPEKADVTIRTAMIEDAQALLDIYGYYVEHTAITYEYEVPSLSEFRDRMRHTLEKYPYLVAQEGDRIIGYAYASAYHPRAAYGWNAEMTVYLDHNARGRSVGQRLYTMLEQILREQGIVNALAMITPPMTREDEVVYGSMYFHEKMGYKLTGRIKNSGYKFDRWFDTITMQKQLNTPGNAMNSIKSFEEVRTKFGL